jgi:hypothetical protein
MAQKTRPPDVLERLKHARWVLRVQVQFESKETGPCVAICDSPHATKDSLRKAYAKAKALVASGQAIYAEAQDRWHGENGQAYVCGAYLKLASTGGG